MMTYYLVNILFILANTVTAQDAVSTQKPTEQTDFTEEVRLTDSVPTVLWTPEFPQVTQVYADLGYKIIVTVLECHMENDKDNYVSISSDKAGKEDVNKFILSINKNRSILYNYNEIYARFDGTGSNSCTLNFTRIGEPVKITTTEEPATTIILPTAGPTVENELTVFLAGRKPSEYNSIKLQRLIKTAIAQMATDYCISKDYILPDGVTLNNVLLGKLLPCPNFWLGYETCVNLTFSVPIRINMMGYELTTEHLREMWDNRKNEEIADGIWEYFPPDTETWLTWEIYLFSGGVAIFLIALLLVRHFSMRVNKSTRRRKLSDTKSIISSKRDSFNDLRPHHFQETPPLFENVIPIYNPIRTTFSSPSYINKSFSEDILDAPVKPNNADLEFVDDEESGA